ncbi:MAG: ABC transporter substrate-binding protein, partial [Pseudomonadota bacterium]
DLAFGLYKNASYYYVPAFHEPGPALEVIANKDFLDGLDVADAKIIEVAAKAVAMETYSDFTYHNIDALPQLMDGKGVELRTWPDEIVEAMGREAKGVLAEIGGADEATREVYDAFIAFRDKAAQYAADAGDLVSLELRRTGLGAA